jgi:hypothetical protein
MSSLNFLAWYNSLIKNFTNYENFKKPNNTVVSCIYFIG